MAHSIIKQTDLQLNGTLIRPQSDTYHYKADIGTLLNFNREDGQTVLATQGWFNAVDLPSQWSANNTDKAGNHLQWQGLSANHKAAYEASVAETAKYFFFDFFFYYYFASRHKQLHAQLQQIQQ